MARPRETAPTRIVCVVTEEVTEPSPHRHVVSVGIGAVTGIPEKRMTVSDVLAAIKDGQGFTVDSHKKDAPSLVVPRPCGGGCHHRTIEARNAMGEDIVIDLVDIEPCQESLE
jgi:hypothetical protein